MIAENVAFGIIAAAMKNEYYDSDAAYLTAVRNDARVVNYLARRLLESKGQMPIVPLAAPAGLRRRHPSKARSAPRWKPNTRASRTRAIGRPVDCPRGASSRRR